MRLLTASLIAITALLTACFVSVADASTNHLTNAMITAQYEKLEQALNRTDDKEPLARFLHNHISEHARFDVSVDDHRQQPRRLTLNKNDYINSYIQGTNFIRDYRASIETLSVDIDPATNHALSREIITEHGTILDPHNLQDVKGRPFISQTTCHTLHGLQNGKIVALGGQCHTSIGLEEKI